MIASEEVEEEELDESIRNGDGDDASNEKGSQLCPENSTAADWCFLAICINIQSRTVLLYDYNHCFIYSVLGQWCSDEVAKDASYGSGSSGIAWGPGGGRPGHKMLGAQNN